MPYTEIKIGTDKEILVKGNQVSTGIYNEDNSNFLENGFLKTGDLGHLSDDSFLFISGRKKGVYRNILW